MSTTKNNKENNQSDTKTHKPEQIDSKVNPLWCKLATTLATCAKQTQSQRLTNDPNNSVQAKLSVGESNDEFEQQADNVADIVMRTPDNHFAPTTHSFPPLTIPQSSVSNSIQRNTNADSKQTHFTPRVADAVKSPGQGSPLPSRIRSKVERVVGVDLSPVRVYQNQQAQDAASDINALAFTHKNNIFLGRGQSNQDTKLMSHEAAHTVQQSQQSTPSIQRFEAQYHESAERTGLGQGPGGLNQQEITQIYVGNWMRDVNQAFVPTMQGAIPHQIRFELLKYMGIKKFGQSFSSEQLGYYIPAEHLDNPAGLLQARGNAGDTLENSPTVNDGQATDGISDHGLGNMQTPQASVHPSASVGDGISANIFAVDQTGVMAFMRRSNQHIERRLILASRTGRNEEGLMHLGAALHTIEDLFAHSNWIEIAASKVLADDPSILEDELQGGNREIFRYSGTLRAGPYAEGMVQSDRPILTTGSFVSLDTAVSVSHEVSGFLREGLHAESDPSVANAQKQLILALLGQYGGTGSAQIVAALQSVPMPSIPPSVLNAAYSMVNPTLSEAADQMEANMAEQRISDTNLMAAREVNRAAMRGEFSSVTQQMMELGARYGEPPVADQEALRIAEAAEREASFAATPSDVLAGPSHSQIAKDHSNSIFFGIAFRLATSAVRLMRQKMVEVWDAQGHTRRYRRDQPAPQHENEDGWPGQEGYVAPWLRGIGATPRTSRDFATQMRRSERTSHRQGNYIAQHGHARGQEYNVEEMREQSASKVDNFADQLNVAGRYALIPRVGRAVAAELFSLSTSLREVAELLRNARTYDQRRTANRRLTALQGLLAAQIEIYARSGVSMLNVSAITMGTVMTAMNTEVATTAVAFTPEQLALQQSGQSSLDMANIDLGAPDLSDFTDDQVRQKVLSLVMQSRSILGHPYEDLWWYSEVRDYITENSAQFAEEVIAKNAGYAGFRHDGNGHTH